MGFGPWDPYKMDEENRFHKVVFQPPYVLCGMCACTYAHTLNTNTEQSTGQKEALW